MTTLHRDHAPHSPRPPADLDLRLVRCFTVLAEHRHFGRAAAALSVAPSTLSRQIDRLEQDVGVRLLDRRPQGTGLTGAGEAFLPRARALLRAAIEAANYARSTANRRITIGYATNLVITTAVRELRHQHPGVDVRTLYLDWHQPRAALLDHRMDAAVVRLPLSTDQLDITVLDEEPRILVLSFDHHLAGKESVRLDDIADEPLPRVADPDWNAFWRVDPRPDGSRAPDGPLVEAWEDALELIATGQAVCLAPAGVRRGLRADLTTVPVEDAEPCRVVLASRAGDGNRLLADFRGIAAAFLARTDPAGALLG
jgi:DNA-binding transcriptional LysR family regulator